MEGTLSPDGDRNDSAARPPGPAAAAPFPPGASAAPAGPASEPSLLVGLTDAHCHLHDARLAHCAADAVAAALAAGVARAVINGTEEADWEAVDTFASRACPPGFAIRSYGLHPWRVAAAAPGWLDRLRARLLADPSAALGETGLDAGDRGRAAAPLEEQERCFAAQLALGRELRRPVAAHCVKAAHCVLALLLPAQPDAHPDPRPAAPTEGKASSAGDSSFPGDAGAAASGSGRDAPSSSPPFPAGHVLILHSFAGPAEVVGPLAARGPCYFSLSGHLARMPQAAAERVARAIPLDRLLIETDAPDGRPPRSKGWWGEDGLVPVPPESPACAAPAAENDGQLHAAGGASCACGEEEEDGRASPEGLMDGSHPQRRPEGSAAAPDRPRRPVAELNHPANLASVLLRVAALRGEAEADVAAAVRENAARVFGPLAGR